MRYMIHAVEFHINGMDFVDYEKVPQYFTIDWLIGGSARFVLDTS